MKQSNEEREEREEERAREDEVVCEETGRRWQRKIRVSCQGTLTPKGSKLEQKSLSSDFLGLQCTHTHTHTHQWPDL